MDVEPFGPVQDDLRAGVVGSLVASSAGGKVLPADLFPSLGDGRPRERKRQTMEDMKAIARAIARGTGGRRG